MSGYTIQNAELLCLNLTSTAMPIAENKPGKIFIAKLSIIIAIKVILITSRVVSKLNNI